MPLPILAFFAFILYDLGSLLPAQDIRIFHGRVNTFGSSIVASYMSVSGLMRV